MQQIELGGMKPVAGCKVLQSAQRFNEQCFMHCHSRGGGEGGGEGGGGAIVKSTCQHSRTECCLIVCLLC